MIKNILIILSTVIVAQADYKRTLFYGNCTSCHMQVGKKSAPHFSEIKGYYLLAYPKREDFIKHLSSWVHNPDKKSAKLPHAIKEFKQVMPNLGIDLDILKDIAAYLYASDEF